MNWQEVSAELGKMLDPAHVKKPSGQFGPKGDYIEGWHAIAEANRIFGHGSWSYTIKAMTQDSLVQGKDGRGNPQWQAAYTCIVRVDVGGAVREDVGFGSGFSKQVGDAIEGATKEAVTDALKRALRTFGNPFGLALYDKTRANVGNPDAPPPFNSAAARDRLKGKVEKAATVAALQEIWDTEAETLKAVDEPHFAELKAAFVAQKGKLMPPDPAMQAPDAHQYQ